MRYLASVALVVAVAITAMAAGVHADEAGSSPAPAPVTSAAAPAAPVVPERAPDHLRLWKFDAPVVPVDLVGSRLDPPADPTVLGWWGQPAGAACGATLLVGHTVSTGGGTLDDLEHTSIGDVANVSGARYRVTRVAVISKAELAERAARLFDQSGPPRLVLITCEGYDAATGTYADNVVVVAEPVRRPAR